MLVIEVEFLAGRYVATAHDDRNRAEWPPHPARLFSALVAALHEGGQDDDERSAERAVLILLENSGAPEIEASNVAGDEPVSRRTVNEVYVPVNDPAVLDHGRIEAALDDIATADASATAATTNRERSTAATQRTKAEGKLRWLVAAPNPAPSETAIKAAVSLQPTGRVRQKRTFPCVTPDSAVVRFAWSRLELPEPARAALAVLLGRVTRLGHSSSLVRCALADTASATLRPVEEGPADQTLRVIGPGQLRRLDDAFSVHRAVRPRVLPFRSQRYRVVEDERDDDVVRGVFESDDARWIVLRAEGSRFHTSRCVDLAKALHRTLLARCPTQPPPELITGRGVEGRPAERPHLAVVPLPNVGHEHAHGGILGIALILPRGVDRGPVVETIAGWEASIGAPSAEAPTLTLTLGRRGVLELRRDEIREEWGLRAWAWCRPSTRWVTVTPIALDANPRKPSPAGRRPGRSRGTCTAGRRAGPRDRGGRVYPGRPSNADRREAVARADDRRRPAGPRVRSVPARGRQVAAGAGARGDHLSLEGSRSSPPRCRAVRGPRAMPPHRREGAVTPLTVDDFAAYFEEVHGHEPFTWQRDLVREVATARRWPETIDLPTGAGKTACIDIALFALALDAGSTEQWCPRRIALVVDRRVVVDQAARRGAKIARKLVKALDGSAAAKVRARLATLTEESPPVRVAVLRGGMPRDDGWARTPDQPTILASTVDQIGSRLLFRGYGVKPGMWPLHAGLLGNDTLILLDEVHLSRPFQQTLGAIRGYRSTAGTDRFHVVALSATPGATTTPPWGLTDDRRKDRLIQQRLTASKVASREESDGRAALVERVAQKAREAAIKHATVAVVVNRVDTAHAVAKALAAGPDTPPATRVELLTGRMRPLDRDDRVAAVEPVIGAVEGRRKTASQADRLIVVATQCIEAGADFDFDALITEHASFDALRQRFGRVDRLGEYKRSEGVVVAVREPDDDGEFKIPKEDPVYGTSLRPCWKLLGKLSTKKKPTIDFGVAAMEAAVAASTLDLTDALSPKPNAPALFPAYLDLWAQTSPRPFVEPEVELFLHGPRSGPADVQVVWRVDLDDPAVWTGDDDEVPAIEHVEALPPSSLESVAVPFALAKRWLRGDRRAGREVLADVDGVLSGERDRVDPRRESRESIGPMGVLWRGDDSIVLRGNADDLRPGDTVVVPASRGGLFLGSFDPDATDPVPDLAERATLVARGRAVLRVHSGALAASGVRVADGGGVEAIGTDPPSWRQRLVKGLAQAKPITLSDGMVVLRGRRVERPPELPAGSPEAELLDPATEQTTDEASVFAGRQVKLSVHSRDVEGWARRFASRVLDDVALRGALAIAGWLHDVGKADPRFQRLLRDGSDITLARDRALDPQDWPLAKSGMDRRDRRRARLAARRSGYPRGTRHEVMSTAMIGAAGVVERVAASKQIEGVDVDLVLHLVASHHGWCRPMAPAVAETEPQLAVSLDHGGDTLSARAGHDLHRADSTITPRFFRVLERYGWHRLAWLEGILRLADHRASEEEADGDA